MMKKNGFTLAEVLITLSIIGVVATMTLPALMANTQEQQAKTGLKKAINTLTEAAQMNLAIDGFDFGTTKESASEDGILTSTELTSMNFDAIIGKRTNINYKKGVDVPANVSEALKNYKAVYFTDGSALYYNPQDVIVSDAKGNGKEEADKLPFGYPVYYDINGATSPNIISNCSGKTLGDASEVATNYEGLATYDPIAATTACKGANKVIKDIFPIRLRGSVAQPEGYAAVWAYNGDVKGVTTQDTTTSEESSGE